MTPEEMAKCLNGRQYGNETTPHLEAVAKEHNLVIAFGYSDDLQELRGAIHDEFGAYDGTSICVASNGKAFNRRRSQELLESLEEIGIDPPTLIKVDAIWCPKNESGEVYSSWLIKVDGGAPFDIYEDDELYCRGVVFKLGGQVNAEG